MHEQMDLSTNVAESVAALLKSVNLREHFFIKQPRGGGGYSKNFWVWMCR